MSSQSASPASSLNMSTGAFQRHEHLLPEVDSDEEALIKVELDIIKPKAEDGKPQGKTMHVAPRMSPMCSSTASTLCVSHCGFVKISFSFTRLICSFVIAHLICVFNWRASHVVKLSINRSSNLHTSWSPLWSLKRMSNIFDVLQQISTPWWNWLVLWSVLLWQVHPRRNRHIPLSLHKRNRSYSKCSPWICHR